MALQRAAIRHILHGHWDGGRPLAPEEREFCDTRLGRDLGTVRPHDGPGAARAYEYRVRGFTLGTDIAGPSGYQTGRSHGRQNVAHEVAHVIRHRASAPAAGATGDLIQCAQIGRVQPATGSTPPHFIYELDAALDTYSELSGHYGVPVSKIVDLNPTRRATALHHGDRIQVPALDPPPKDSRPVGPAAPALVQSTGTHPIAVRWNRASNANVAGKLSRGTSIGTIGGGADVLESDLQQPAQGVLEEMRLRGLAIASGWIYGYLPSGNVRSTLTAPSASDVNLIARMIWGEQRSQGTDAMTAAAWIARNRYNQGWGSYSQIITSTQFHGLASPSAVRGLTGPDAVRWSEAQTIAQEVIDGTRADPTGGVVYFGNGAGVARRMRSCAARSTSFRWGTITGTNFHYSNGDYTSSGCTIP